MGKGGGGGRREGGLGMLVKHSKSRKRAVSKRYCNLENYLVKDVQV
jgi:hypothetical protein